MKTVRTLARALAVAVAVAAAPADADMPGISAPLETFRSPSGGFTLEVLAMDAPANKGVVVDRVQCLLTCEEEDHDGIPEAAIVLRLRGPDGKVRWTTGVDFGPSQATVANDGKHVALFNAASILEELDLPVAVVLFGEDGTLLKGFRLGDLLDRKTITRDLTRSVGSIHWYGYVGKVGHRFLEDGSALELHVAAKVPPPMYPQPPPRIVRILLPSLRVDPAVIVEPPGTPEELVRRFAAASDDAHRERILAMLLEARSPALGAFWVSLARDPAREALLDYALDGLHARGSEDLRSLLPLLGRSTNFDTRLLRALCWREDLRADPEALLARMRDPKATAEVRRLALHAAMQRCS